MQVLSTVHAMEGKEYGGHWKLERFMSLNHGHQCVLYVVSDTKYKHCPLSMSDFLPQSNKQIPIYDKHKHVALFTGVIVRCLCFRMCVCLQLLAYSDVCAGEPGALTVY